MKHTPLFERHVRDAAAVINIKGYARAMHYGGLVAEHRATRERVSLCDVSHMGELDFRGPEALALVQKLITNDAGKLAVDQALYSVMCDEDGMVIDDLVCYRLGPDHFVWVVNVTKTDDDYQWVLKHAHGMDVTVTNVSSEIALLALQGPESREVLQRITEADLSTLKYYWLTQTTIHTSRAQVACIISRTGYTGERGYEIMVARGVAPWVWDELLMAGRPLGIVPHGVAARESLRTEAGYLLNGNDMDARTNPIEAGLEWVIKPAKEFIGKEAIARAKASGVQRRLVGLEVHGRHTVRNGHPIYVDGQRIGHVTSGPLSPALAGRNLGLGYVAAEHATIGTEVEIDIRGTKCKARITAMPFAPRRVRDEPLHNTYSPCALRFSAAHVWARSGDDGKDVVTLGLSDFGQRTLGDILCVELPAPGTQVARGSVIAWVDSYRKPFDIASPLAGEVIATTGVLLENPAQINAYPYSREGMLKIRMSARQEYDEMLDFAQYSAHTRRLQHYDEWSSEQRMT